MRPSERLRSVSLFSTLTRESLERVAAITHECSYARGTFLHRQEEAGDALFVIEEGEAVLHQADLRGAQRPIGYLHEGSASGEAALLFGDPYGSFAQTTTDLRALRIDKEDWDALVREHPEVQRQMSLTPLWQERLRARSVPWPAEDEPPLLLRKRHWIAFASTLSVPLVTATLLSTLAWLLDTLGLHLGVSSATLLVGIVPALMTVWAYADWQNDYFLLTPKRLVHREKIALLYETWNEIPLARIQNTEVRTDFLGRLLGYGTLHVQTAGRGTIVMDRIPDPSGFQDLIYLHTVYLRSRAMQEERQLAREEYLRHKAIWQDAVPDGDSPSQGTIHSVVTPGPLGRLFRVQPRSWTDQSLMVVWHKHWVFLLRQVFLPVVAIAVIVGLIMTSIVRLQSWYSPSLLLTSLVLWVVAVFWLWWEYEDWRNDIYVVTDRLIIDVEKRPLFFDEQRKQAPLDMIQNVSLHQQGLLANLLNYGDVLIQTAGTTGDFTFDGVGRPTDVQREVFRRMDSYEDEKRRRERERKTAEFAAWFQAHDEIDHRPHTTSLE